MSCFNDSCRITMPLTPKEIKEQYLDSLNQPFDVFALSVGKLTLDAHPTVVPALVDICWRRFRNRPIGDYDYELWFEALDDKVNEIWYSYKRTIPLFMDAEIASTVTGKETITETIVNDRDALMTNNLTRTNDLTATNALSEVVDGTQITGENVIIKSEDNPDTEAGATQYLSNRTTTDRNVQVDNDVSTLNTGTVKNTGTVVDSGTVTNADDSTVDRDSVIEREDGLFAENALIVSDKIREGFDRFLDELEPLFLNRW